LRRVLLLLLHGGTTWCAHSLRLGANRVGSQLMLVLDGRQPNGSSHAVSLLCFTVVRPRTPEVDLLRSHLAHKMLAGCDRFFVFSNETLPLKQSRLLNDESLSLRGMSGAFEAAIEGSMDAGLEGYPPEHPTTFTAKNTFVFRQAWSQLFASGAYRDHDWTVKVDPDTVLFPERLRVLLKDYDPRKAIGMFDGRGLCKTSMGGLAVLSRSAVELLHTKEATFSKMPVEREDGLLVACMKTFGGTVVSEPNLVLNPTPDCALAPWKAAYHARKVSSRMEKCYMQASLKLPPPPELLHTTCL